MGVPRFVIGFLFNQDLSKVVLIQKNRPYWQKDKLNGVGGKVEPGENALEAMKREFKEETGVSSDNIDWRHFADVRDNNTTLFSAFFAIAKSPDLFYSVRTTTEELIVIVSVDQVQEHMVLSNIKWLIPLAVDTHQGEFPNQFASVSFG